ncbi:unnamed protein product [Prorocentrum cordatum]|uniref:EF-hand domain-containing protein n=1 Tax=Prorocentrum cordatum TaxID=2364126 RepID=A0ABN9SK84_9DINO|nr:unnamed protein product [Polarella glacialis]
MWNLQQKPTSPPQQSFATAFATRVRSVVEKLRSPMHHVLSWSCWNHDLSLTSRFSTDSVDGVTMENALQRFLELDGVNASNRSYIDRCEGFACGTGCAGVHHSKGEVSDGKQQVASSKLPLSEFRGRVRKALAAQGWSSGERGNSSAGFRILDSDGNGVLEQREVEGVADWAGSEISAGQADYAFQMMDRDGDGRLSPDEFGLLLEGGAPPVSVVDFKSRVADTYSSPGEAIEDMGPEPIGRSRFAAVAEAFQRPLTAEQADYAFDGLDLDRDGSLTTFEIMSVLDSGQFYPDERNLRREVPSPPASATALATAARERAESRGAPPVIMAVGGAALGLLLLPASYVVLVRGLKAPPGSPSEHPPLVGPASPLARALPGAWSPSPPSPRSRGGLPSPAQRGLLQL